MICMGMGDYGPFNWTLGINPCICSRAVQTLAVTLQN
jgi:hypothetical protein